MVLKDFSYGLTALKNESKKFKSLFLLEVPKNNYEFPQICGVHQEKLVHINQVFFSFSQSPLWD